MPKPLKYTLAVIVVFVCALVSKVLFFHTYYGPPDMLLNIPGGLEEWDNKKSTCKGYSYKVETEYPVADSQKEYRCVGLLTKKR